jgi:DNA-directed RNA polymerase subunit M/transcription elongation factor TFIIS
MPCHEKMEALREYARTHLAQHVPARPYAKNIEKAVWLWAADQARPATYENRQFRTLYKHKIIHIMKELTRDASKVACELVVVKGERVRVRLTLQPQLVWRLLHKELTSQDLVRVPADILWPDGPYAKALFKARSLELAREKAKAKDDADYEGLFKCRKCKSTKTSYYQMQTRSADEPMVRFLARLLFLLFSKY